MTNGTRPVPRTFLGRGSNWYKKCFGTKYKKLENISFCTKTPNQNNLVFLYQPEPFVLVHFFRKSVKILSRGKRTVQKRKWTVLQKADGQRYKSGRFRGWKWTGQVMKVDVQRDERARPELKGYPIFVSIWNKWMNYGPDRNLEGTLTLLGSYPDFDLKVNLTRI